MRKLEKLMLEEINSSEMALSSTEWSNGLFVGGYTFDKLLRRVYAVMDLAEAGLIVDHYTSIYHNQNTTCAECS